jgi:hypothetical protein
MRNVVGNTECLSSCVDTQGTAIVRHGVNSFPGFHLMGCYVQRARSSRPVRITIF